MFGRLQGQCVCVCVCVCGCVCVCVCVLVGGGAVGEGTGGEAHELKQGAHDEEEEPMYCNTHERALENMRTHKQREGEWMYLCVCVCVCLGLRGWGRGDVGPVTSKVLGHSPPPPSFPPSPPRPLPLQECG